MLQRFEGHFGRRSLAIRDSNDNDSHYHTQWAKSQNSGAPGFLYTPMVAPHLDEEARERRRQTTPLGTEGTAWDVAWAALFLASDEARWVTGVTLPVDAGLLATSPISMLPYIR